MRVPIELLTNAEMAEADRLAAASDIAGMSLMEAAGEAVARAAARRLYAAGGRRVAVVCGPGNNGGDGYVAARLLRAVRRVVRATGPVPLGQIKGDAAEAGRAWSGDIEAIEGFAFDDANLVIDALFGAGLSRDLQGEAKHAVERLEEWGRSTGCPILAV